MFETPPMQAYPNGLLPAINDSDLRPLTAYRGMYEWAAQLLGDERLADPVSLIPTDSVNLPDTGLAVLRRGRGQDAACAILDYGPHGGGHGHYDKLQLLLHARGREWLLDPGRLNYSHALYKSWVKHTAAHNTVAVNGTSQAPTIGRLLFFTRGDGWTACGAEAAGAYEDATLRRWLWMGNGVLVDVFQVDARREVQADWLLHVDADRCVPPQATAAPVPIASLGDKDGYQHLREGQRFEPGPGDPRDASTGRDAPAAGRPADASGSLPSGPWRFVVADGQAEHGLSAWFLPHAGEAILLARSTGHRHEDQLPCLVRRRQGVSQVYVAVYDLSEKSDHVTGLAAVEGQPLAAGITTRTGSFTISFSATGVRIAAP
jgi:hypothetical protein